MKTHAYFHRLSRSNSLIFGQTKTQEKACFGVFFLAFFCVGCYICHMIYFRFPANINESPQSRVIGEGGGSGGAGASGEWEDIGSVIPSVGGCKPGIKVPELGLITDVTLHSNGLLQVSLFDGIIVDRYTCNGFRETLTTTTERINPFVFQRVESLGWSNIVGHWKLKEKYNGVTPSQPFNDGEFYRVHDAFDWSWRYWVRNGDGSENVGPLQTRTMAGNWFDCTDYHAIDLPVQPCLSTVSPQQGWKLWGTSTQTTYTRGIYYFEHYELTGNTGFPWSVPGFVIFPPGMPGTTQLFTELLMLGNDVIQSGNDSGKQQRHS